ncbi:MAG: RNA methyltransferase [Flavobacteriales bacterium]|nr:RNA methyltransferase [Flavobacteriales bacterium]
MVSKNQLKFLKSLNLSKFRNKNNMFIVEGWRSIQDFINSDHKLVSIFATSSWINLNSNVKNIIQINQEDLNKVSSLKNPNQVLAIFEKKKIKSLSNVNFKKIVVFLENISNPGNLGTIIRTCDWFGLNTIVCSENSVDVYNPKVIQSSMGSLSRVNVVYSSTDLFLSFINKKKVVKLVADLEGENVLSMGKISSGVLFFGNESKGISEKIKKHSFKKITIPKKVSNCESLNLSVSFGIILSKILN